MKYFHLDRQAIWSQNNKTKLYSIEKYTTEFAYDLTPSVIYILTACWPCYLQLLHIEHDGIINHINIYEIIVLRKIIYHF